MDNKPEQTEDLHDEGVCPECGGKLESGQCGSGVVCTVCDYWFCF